MRDRQRGVWGMKSTWKKWCQGSSVLHIFDSFDHLVYSMPCQQHDTGNQLSKMCKSEGSNDALKWAKPDTLTISDSVKKARKIKNPAFDFSGLSTAESCQGSNDRWPSPQSDSALTRGSGTTTWTRLAVSRDSSEWLEYFWREKDSRSFVGSLSCDDLISLQGGPPEFYSGNWSILYAVWEISFYF